MSGKCATGEKGKILNPHRLPHFPPDAPVPRVPQGFTSLPACPASAKRPSRCVTHSLRLPTTLSALHTNRCPPPQVACGDPAHPKQVRRPLSIVPAPYFPLVG